MSRKEKRGGEMRYYGTYNGTGGVGGDVGGRVLGHYCGDEGGDDEKSDLGGHFCYFFYRVVEVRVGGEWSLGLSSFSAAK
jgi:hypothetical protein